MDVEDLFKDYKDGINYELNGPIINDYNGGTDALFDIDDDIEDKNDKGLATKEEGNEEIINNNNIEWLDNEIEYKDSTTFMIIIITISSTVLVASVLGIGLLVFYCKRVIKICNPTSVWKSRTNYNNFPVQNLNLFFYLIIISFLSISRNKLSYKTSQEQLHPNNHRS